MSDQLMDRVHEWRFEHSTDPLTPLDLDAIRSRGQRRRRIRHGLTVAIPTVVVAALLAATLSVVETQTSAHKVRPVDSPQSHSTIIDVPAGERVPAMPGFDVRFTADGYFCIYTQGTGETGCTELGWAEKQLDFTVNYEAPLLDPSKQFVIYGYYLGAGLRDVIVHGDDADYTATIVRVEGHPNLTAFFVQLPELGNIDPTITAYDDQGTVLDTASSEPAQWNPPTPQEVRDRCQLNSSIPIVGNHPIDC
jgi:hypothetical protein